jgi:hypothetical protein
MNTEILEKLIHLFEESGKVTRARAGEKSQYHIIGTLISMTSIVANNAKDIGFILTVQKDDGSCAQIISQARNTHPICLNTKYVFPCEVNNSNTTISRAPHRLRAQPRLKSNCAASKILEAAL